MPFIRNLRKKGRFFASKWHHAEGQLPLKVEGDWSTNTNPYVEILRRWDDDE